jgi:enamine deaminase RidA (YjgF/YER057c/UK114 family)
MTEVRTVLPADWKRPPGYSHAVVAGGAVHVAGQIGWDPVSQGDLPESFGDQWDATLQNLVAVIRQAGSDPSLIASMTVYVTSIEQYDAAARELGSSWMRHIGKHFPAITLVEVSRLFRDEALVEISALAMLGEGSVA